jgi:membrane protein YdbS with pleckstrin-like domain
MKPLAFYPDAGLKTKLYVIVTLLAVVCVIGVGILVWGITGDEGADNPLGLALTITLVANAVWVIPLWLAIAPYCNRLRYEIHPDEVIVYAGLVTKSVKHVPYRTVTNLQVLQGPFDRIFGIGTLNIQTAGMSGQQGAEESLIGLPDFQEVYAIVADALRRFRSAMAPDQAGEELAPAADGGVMAELLAEVRAIRIGLEARRG